MLARELYGWVILPVSVPEYAPLTKIKSLVDEVTVIAHVAVVVLDSLSVTDRVIVPELVAGLGQEISKVELLLFFRDCCSVSVFV